MDTFRLLSIVLVVAAAIGLLWWAARKRGPARDVAEAADRLDTLTAWPPQAIPVLRPVERIAYSTLRLALPGYMVLAQVPISRFIDVSKRNSYAEWMRRLGSQCVDFVICDVTSQVVAVVELRPPAAQLDERMRRRFDRVARVFEAVGIPLHAWNQESLPSIDSARASIAPKAPAVPAGLERRVAEREASAARAEAPKPFPDTDHNRGRDDTLAAIEVVELPEPRASTWFDDLDSVSSTLPPPGERRSL